MSRDTRPPEIQAIFDALEKVGPLLTIEELNKKAAELTREYNSRPQAALGGLSPEQMYQLLYGDWQTRGPLRLNEALTLEDLSESAILTDVRTLLEYFVAADGTKETQAGNLPRAVVAELLPRLKTSTRDAEPPPGKLESPRSEGDMRWLPAIRHTMMFAGLLIRRRGLRVSQRGQELLADDRAGALFALLFRTFFRELNLGAMDMVDRYQDLQSTIAYSFYRLRSVRKWSSSEKLAGEAWLESSKGPLSEFERLHQRDFSQYSFLSRVLDPLAKFGLLEERRRRTKDPWDEWSEFRVTPLYDRFLRFEFG